VLAWPQRHADGVGDVACADAVADDRPVLLGQPWSNAYRCDLAPPGVAGERIEVILQLHGHVAGAIVPDGLFEVWHGPTATAATNHPDDRRNLPLDGRLRGYGRASTYTDGCAHFNTVKPGRVPWPDGGMQAPHINLSIFARGVLNRLATRSTSTAIRRWPRIPC